MSLIDAIDDYLVDIQPSNTSKGLTILDEYEEALQVTAYETGEYMVAVPSARRKDPYNVSIHVSSGKLVAVCDCPAYKREKECQHCVAAVFHLQDIMDEDDMDGDDPDEFSDPHASTIFMPQFDFVYLNNLAGSPSRKAIDKWLAEVELIEKDHNAAAFRLYANESGMYEVSIRSDGKDCYETTCDCYQDNHPICVHTLACFQYLYMRDRNFFRNSIDQNEEKNELLAPYGLTVDDPEAEQFTWQTDYYGNLEIAGKPASIIPSGDVAFINDLKKNIIGPVPSGLTLLRPRLPGDPLVDYEVGILFDLVKRSSIGFQLDALQLQEKKGKQKIKKLSINNPANYVLLSPLNDDLFNLLTEFSDKNVLEWLSEAGGNPSLKTYYNPWNQLTENDRKKILGRYSDLLRKAWPALCDHPHLYLHTEGQFSQRKPIPVKAAKHPVVIGFRFAQEEKFITISLTATINGERFKGQNIPLLGNLVFRIEDTLYLPEQDNIVDILKRFAGGNLRFPLSDKKTVLTNLLGPMQEKFDVETDENLNFEIQNFTPQPRVLLSELNEQSLLVRPQFMYNDILADYGPETEIASDTADGKLVIMPRDKSEEKKLYDFLRTLHPRFVTQNNNQHYYLPFGEVLKNNWFLIAIKQIEASGYPVFGLKDLKKFRYNTATPKINIEAGSGIDWFDLKISAQWGDRHVPFHDLRRAIINRQEAVLLDDGTLGMIPEEWLSQYRTLLKIGNEENGSLRISKLHFDLLDKLDSAIDNQQVREEIFQKKNKLRNFQKISNIKPSKAINATFRPYQVAGFQWFNALDDLGWGGCLADDMGLGKTLQTIAFLQHIKEKNPGCTSLVVCPTSLLYNWENELQKFCPSLQYYVYYGLQRSFTDEHFENYDLVLTSYGIARNDLEALMKFHWQYIVLDESQAIKNPDALVSRAVSHLKAKNKIILSGTPVQNNTYDLYAQFNFLNPGMLGSRDFFREEFAAMIDKGQDKQKAEELKRLVYPFMLRRTKEQVARDLPDKTETVVWCTMAKAQRRLYDDYKNHYRNLLLKKIDEEGIGKSGVYVLEGLLRLRQICDHPALLKDPKIEAAESVKSDELLREIRENTGEHKLLVFSQFTEMLALVREELEQGMIDYCYLDGSTPAAKRKTEVNRFQDDDTIKVFLISLKAGGVGLNLTAADYVYLIDPWWNPAVEQQAIDRTHRIGQTRKIFAYKMICKDTVEEKILQLQQKKKALADDLVSEDAGFMKKLTRDDVAYLFS